MRSGIATVSTKNVVTQSVIVTGQVEKKRRDTERGGTERKRRDVTSPLAGTPAHTRAQATWFTVTFLKFILHSDATFPCFFAA